MEDAKNRFLQLLTHVIHEIINSARPLRNTASSLICQAKDSIRLENWRDPKNIIYKESSLYTLHSYYLFDSWRKEIFGGYVLIILFLSDMF